MEGEHPRKNRRLKRRRRSRFEQAALRLLRLTLLAGAGVVGAWALFQFLVKVVHPYRLGRQQAEEIAALRRQLADQEAYNADKRRRLAYLVSREGAETEARRAHFRRPGEVVYLLDNNALAVVRQRAAARAADGAAPAR